MASMGTCAGSTSVSTMESSSASSGCDYATGCRRARATAGNATASPSAIRGGGRELVSRIAAVHIYITLTPWRQLHTASTSHDEQKLDLSKAQRLPQQLLEGLLHRGEPGQGDTALHEAAGNQIALWFEGANEAISEATGAHQ